MKKSGTSMKNDNDIGTMNIGLMGSTKDMGMNSSNSASLKGKLNVLEVWKAINIGCHSKRGKRDEHP